MADRTSRETQTRERQERRVWRPGSALEAPEAPLGYTHRWIRESVMENHSEVSITIDHLVNWGPKRNKEWELMIVHLTIMLEHEGVKMEQYGWEEIREEEKYFIHLSW